jgi:hypothetical protein
MITRPDPEALLVALVLCPGTYSRNRFFELFADPAFFAVRRRAKLLRSIILDVTQGDPSRRGHIVTIDEPASSAAHATLTYVVPTINLKRTTTLSELELALVRYAFSRRTGPFEPLGDDDPIRARIEDALRRLAPDLAARPAGPIGAQGGPEDDLDEEGLEDDTTLGLSPLPDPAPER